jgi:hypothetical protein
VRRFTVAALLSLSPLAAAGAVAQPASLSATADLAPGRFVWRDDGSAAGPVRVLVSLTLQRAFVFRGTTLIGMSSVSSGAPGRDTPTGTFPILQKDKDHHSNVYDDAPMPYMLRLTWDGVALHAGKVTGEPASHGCVRLPTAFARRLFEIADVGSTVTVTDDVPDLPDSADSSAGAVQTAETR